MKCRPLASPTAEGRDYPTQAGGSTSTAPPQGTAESFVPDDDGENLPTADDLGTGVDRGTDGDGVGVPPSPPLRAAAEDGSPPPSQVLHRIAFRLEGLVQAGGFIPTPEDHAAIVEMVNAHEGPESAAIARHWLRRQPEGVAVIRRSGGVAAGVWFRVAVERTSAEDRAADARAELARRFLEDG